MTNWVPDILDATGPRYKAIVDALERAIQAKQLHPGQRLPTQRDLAYTLGLSVQTVSRAYAEAERKGLTTGEIGRGTYVQHLGQDRGTGFITDSEQANVLDFSNVMPVVSDLHVEALRETMTEAVKGAAIQRMLEYRPSQGTVPHRQAGQAWLERNGVRIAAENIIVTNGTAHGIWTAMASLVEPGEVVATEALVDTSIITTASVLKLRLRGLALDEQGIIPEAFEEACEREPVKLLCITPTFSNPTVSLMGEARRAEIAELARRYDVAIIEDDAFGPLIPNRPKPLWHFAPERCFYVTGFSKAVMVSLRTGYLAGPPAMNSRLVSRLRATGWISSTWTAEIAARWLYDGTLDRLIAWQQQKLTSRHEIVRRTLGAFDCKSHPHAMHAWLTLPDQWRSLHFVEQARARGLLVTPPDPFVVGRAADPHAVRLALGDTTRDDGNFTRGLERLAALLHEDPDPISTDY